MAAVVAWAIVWLGIVRFIELFLQLIVLILISLLVGSIVERLCSVLISGSRFFYSLELCLRYLGTGGYITYIRR